MLHRRGRLAAMGTEGRCTAAGADGRWFCAYGDQGRGALGYHTLAGWLHTAVLDLGKAELAPA